MQKPSLSFVIASHLCLLTIVLDESLIKRSEYFPYWCSCSLLPVRAAYWIILTQRKFGIHCSPVFARVAISSKHVKYNCNLLYKIQPITEYYLYSQAVAKKLLETQVSKILFFGNQACNGWGNSSWPWSNRQNYNV